MTERHKKHPGGRPSLGVGKTLPRQYRVSPADARRFDALAALERRPLAAIVREALDARATARGL